MKLAGYGKEIFELLSQQFNEGIVVTVSRQLNQIHLFQFTKVGHCARVSCTISPILQPANHRGAGKKESERMGKIAWGNV